MGGALASCPTSLTSSLGTRDPVEPHALPGKIIAQLSWDFWRYLTSAVHVGRAHHEPLLALDAVSLHHDLH